MNCDIKWFSCTDTFFENAENPSSFYYGFMYFIFKRDPLVNQMNPLSRPKQTCVSCKAGITLYIYKKCLNNNNKNKNNESDIHPIIKENYFGISTLLCPPA